VDVVVVVGESRSMSTLAREPDGESPREKPADDASRVCVGVEKKVGGDCRSTIPPKS
jgi:hypothetical protein